MLILSVTCVAASAHPAGVQFHHLRRETGLSQSSIQCIAQDDVGFLWFGTEDGLNRFDGYRCTVFRHDPADSFSISDNYIWRLLKSSSGDLWIGTLSGGLNRYQMSTGRFIAYRHVASDSSSLSSDNVTGLYEDREGSLWVGTWGGGLCRLEPGSGTFVHYRHDPAERNSLSGNFVSSIREDARGNLWIGTWQGLSRLDPERRSFTRYANDPGDPRSLSNDRIWDLFIDAAGDLWVATQDGLDRLDRKRGTFVRYFGAGNPRGTSSGSVVSSVLEDRRGRLWVGTFENGVFLIDRVSGKAIQYNNVSNAVDGSIKNDVLSMLEDRSGALWFGTSDGVSCFDPQAEKFELHSVSRDGPDGSSNVRGICESRAGGVWIGMNGKGLMHVTPGNHSYRRYVSREDDPASLSSDHVLSVLEQRGGTLWVGTLGHGLNRLLPGSRRFRRFVSDPSDTHTLSDNTVIALLEDHGGNVWAGTNGGGLDMYDPVKARFTRYVYSSEPGSISGNWIWALYEDSRDVLWVGTWTRGLDRFDPRTGKFEVFTHDPADRNSISNNSILCITEDSRGFLWIGTHGGGVNRFDPGTRRFTHFTESDGLPNNVVLGVLPDRHGNIWLSTNRGLSRFNPSTGEFRNFDIEDGLQGDEFDHGAFCRLRDGRMLFGGTGGFNVFDPDSIRDNTYVPPIVITGFSVFDEPARLPHPIYATDRITLSYTQNFFSFDFAALSFASSSKNRYMYKLEGLDRDWINAGRRRVAYYTNIPSGEYVFRVKGSNNDGLWNTAGASVRLSITPPFWDAFWFRLATTTAVLAGIFYLYRRRIRGLERDRSTQEAFSLRLMESQENERKRIAGELHDSLGQDLLVIRNRAILGLRDRAVSSHVRAQLEQISSIVTQSINGVREISYGLRPYQLDRLGLTKAIRSVTSDLASPIRFKVTVDPIDDEIGKEKAIHLYRIVQEGVNNILKHSLATEAAVSVRVEGDDIHVTISDNGNGMAARSGSDGETRGGIGLTGIAERARALGGRVSISSPAGKGTLLTVIIPREGSSS